ncbi:MAG: UDP-glucose 4-epimerase [Chloroflexota bacterium]|nr:UDP-glucose 4-epimerase [Chloroflexota bacterium]
MSSILVTGGGGFLGQHLCRRLLADGHSVVSYDLHHDADVPEGLVTVDGDIRDGAKLGRVFADHGFDAVLHCASAVVAHAIHDRDFVRTTNVDGTRRVAELATEHGVRRLVFISTCCLWKRSLHRPVMETDTPEPGEPYGWSKWEAEKVLLEEEWGFSPVILRSPTVVDAGRVGLLSILFEFIEAGKKVWVVGAGDNRHQFVSARDLVDACVRALDHPEGGVYNVGSDHVEPLREIYRRLIAEAGTRARVGHLPRALSLFAMRAAYRLGISPLGPYQYRMIAEDFVFDTSKIQREMGWKPTIDNSEMMLDAFRYYRENREEITTREDLSAHRQPAKMGVIKLLKWVS